MNRAIQKRKSDGLHRLVEDIFATRTDEVQCEEAAIQMVLCADQLMTTDEARQQFPALFHHFHFCPDCAIEYQMLMELARLETVGQLAAVERIPPRPPLIEATGNLLASMQEVIRFLFTGFTLAPADLPVRGLTFGLLPTIIELAGDKITVELDVARSKVDPAQRILFCRVETSASEIEDNLAGSPVWLTVESTGKAEQRQILNEAGEVGFDQLAPGHYQCWLQLAGQTYVIDGLVLP